MAYEMVGNGYYQAKDERKRLALDWRGDHCSDLRSKKYVSV